MNLLNHGGGEKAVHSAGSFLSQRRTVLYTFLTEHETPEIISVWEMTGKSKAANGSAPELIACHQHSTKSFGWQQFH